MPTPAVSLLSLFTTFLKLGFTAFGGPVAHLGFFQEEFVRKRKWISEEDFADRVALCQFLPGPASSQVGLSIGYQLRGVRGAFLSWLAFTAPSAAVMIGFALGLQHVETEGAGWLIGLRLAALAVVINACWNMGVKLCPDRLRRVLALGVAAFLVLFSGPTWQWLAMLFGAGVGIAFLGNEKESLESKAVGASTRSKSWLLLVLFAALLFGLAPILSALGLQDHVWLDRFYRAGSLVFGGGHVVLPLLDEFVVSPGWVTEETFLAGYGVTQAVPGPLFTFSAFLGSSLTVGPGGVAGGCLALLMIYVPSFLLVMGVLPLWTRLRNQCTMRSALLGTNAAVVGLLLAAVYDPLWNGVMLSTTHFSFGVIAFALLRFVKCPPWALVLLSALSGSVVFS